MAGSVEQKLASLGITLPTPAAPVANYVGTKQSGDLLFVSGRVSQRRGEVGTELSVDDARILTCPAASASTPTTEAR